MARIELHLNPVEAEAAERALDHIIQSHPDLPHRHSTFRVLRKLQWARQEQRRREARSGSRA